MEVNTDTEVDTVDTVVDMVVAVTAVDKLVQTKVRSCSIQYV